MRVVPILMAVVMAVVIFAVVIEREAVLAFFSDETAAEEAAPEANASAEDAAAEKLIKVVAQRSVAQKIESPVVLRGQTQAARQVEVRAETTSTVISAPLRKGVFVEENDLLCRLDPGTRGATLAEAKARLSEAQANRSEAASRVPEAAARLNEAEARLDEALTNQNVARRLNADGFAAETRVKNTDAAVAAAEASVEAARSGLSAAQSGILSADAGIETAAAGIATAEKELQRLEIRAPFAGLLESDTAELGSLLQAGGLCATVIQLDPIKLVAFVPETEVERLSVGAMAGARLAAGGDVRGAVTFLSRSADETTRTFRVEIEVPNPGLKIRDGQTAEILIASAGGMAHLLPSSALTLDDQGALGLRIVEDDGLVVFNPVTVLRDTADGIWLAGLPDRADVIVVGQEYVRAGVKAEPTFREQTQ